MTLSFNDAIPETRLCPFCGFSRQITGTGTWAGDCASCDHLRSVEDRERRELAKAIARETAKARPREESSGSRRALSVREVAKDMRKRPSTIRAHIDAGNVVVIPNSKPMRISPAELARLQREGLPDLPGAPPSKGKSRRRRAGPRQRLMPNGESAEIPGELRSFRSPPAKT